MTDSPTIFLSAAEASGDAHAAGLIAALKAKRPGARFIGAAGPKMAAAGCEGILDLTGRATMLHGPLFKLAYYWRAIRRLRRALRDLRPDVFIPVDSPALNWHLAAAAKKSAVPVMHYVAPQVWAWAAWRIKKLRRLTDYVACILPFEQEYFRTRGVAATFVGHPLFDHLPPRTVEQCPDLIDAWHGGRWRVALLPGSRPGEIKNHAAAMQATAEAIRARRPEAVCTFCAADEAAAERIRQEIGAETPLAVARTAEVLGESHFAVAASGTVTLNVAHFGVPMVVVYKTSRLGYHLLGRWLLHTRELSLVNILAGRRIVPELMPWFGDVKHLIDATLDAMDDYGWLVDTRNKLLALTAPLRSAGPATAAENAADLVLGLLKKE
jgi:lipid-A-disaccharide synthase